MKMTRKGQITIPIAFRRKLRWERGDVLTFSWYGRDLVIIRKEEATHGIAK